MFHFGIHTAAEKISGGVFPNHDSHSILWLICLVYNATRLPIMRSSQSSVAAQNIPHASGST
jgi:hypothetical protein